MLQIWLTHPVHAFQYRKGWERETTEAGGQIIACVITIAADPDAETPANVATKETQETDNEEDERGKFLQPREKLGNLTWQLPFGLHFPRMQLFNIFF